MGGGNNIGVDVPHVSLGRRHTASSGMWTTSARGWAARFATVELRLVYFSVSRLDAQAHQMIPPFLFLRFLGFLRKVYLWGVKNESSFSKHVGCCQTKMVMFGRVQL